MLTLREAQASGAESLAESERAGLERRERRAVEAEETLRMRTEAFDAREHEAEERVARLEADADRREEAFERTEAELAEREERLRRKEAELGDYVRQVQGVLNRRDEQPVDETYRVGVDWSIEDDEPRDETPERRGFWPSR